MKTINPSLIPYTYYKEGCFSFVENDNFAKGELYPTDKSTLTELSILIDANKDTSFYNSIGLFNAGAIRTTEQNIVAITKHIVDVDAHGLMENITKQEAKLLSDYILETAEAGKLPKPSLIIFSGRGIHISWNLKETNGNPQNIELWKETQRALIQKLDDIINGFANGKNGGFANFLEVKGKKISDAVGKLDIDTCITNPNRVMRTANSYNLKANKSVETLYISKAVYTQETFINGFGFELITKKKGKISLDEILKIAKSVDNPTNLEATLNGKKAHFTAYCKEFSLKVYRKMRLRDMLTLIELRNAGGVLEGYRNTLIGIAGQLIREQKKDPNEILEELQDINQRFKKPLSDEEIERWFKAVINSKQQYFKSETIISKLAISDEEQEKLTAILSKKELKRRNTKRHNEAYQPIKERNQTARAERLAKVRAYRLKGATIPYIAKVLNVTTRTIDRDIKLIKKLGI